MPVRPIVAVIAPADPLPDADWVAFGAGPSAEVIARRVRAFDDDPVVLLGGDTRRRVDLTADPDTDLSHPALPVFRTSVLRESGLTALPDVDADLAAGLLVGQVLASTPRPTVALVRLLRVPPPRWQRQSRYSVVLPRWAELLDRQSAPTPRWLQRLVVGPVFALLREDAGLATVTASLEPATVEAFHAALRKIVRHLDDDVITGHYAPDVTDELRAALLLGVPERPGHTRPTQHLDVGRQATRTTYLYSTATAQPVENGDVAHAKLRTVDVMGRPLLAQRIVWGAGELSVSSDPASGGPEIDARASRGEGRVRRLVRVVDENRGLPARVGGDALIRARARTSTARDRYAGAWLLMDRDDAAQDNAEHLYRYLRAERPDVNAWFVLAPTSSDWTRLTDEGFRLIEFGSAEHFVALTHCVHLVSSQADEYVIHPFRKHLLGAGHWRFTFLQHGVLRHDLSRWLNRKPFDMFVTSTPDEQAAIVDDGSPYVFTDLETQMTGLPRHDRLWRLGEQEQDRSLLLLMPTWRNTLLGVQADGNERPLLADFWRSEYAQSWLALLESDRLREVCAEAGWQLCFVPHPNMQDYLRSATLPDHVRALRYKDIDIQRTLARAATVVTDYSSLTNEAAYIRRPVVYYQFDGGAFFAGGHFHRQGAWHYERDGFGPVTTTADAAITAIERIAVSGPEPEYIRRTEAGFPLRDGRCCERTAAQIEAIPPRPVRRR